MIDFPNTPTLNQVFTAGAASWKWDSVKWVTNSAAADYVLLTPASGATVTITPTSKVIVNASTALATLTLRLSAALDKAAVRISTRNRIDALTINSVSGAAVDWSGQELPANGIIALTFVISLNRWVRA
jgi:hypothetical protein